MTTDERHPITPTDGEPMAPVSPAPCESVTCAAFREHQFTHRREGRRWLCDTCAAIERGRVVVAEPGHEPLGPRHSPSGHSPCQGRNHADAPFLRGRGGDAGASHE
jgi:hypothetical protein